VISAGPSLLDLFHLHACNELFALLTHPGDFL
jgi:hypothetical protein